eukprot:163417_1
MNSWIFLLMMVQCVISMNHGFSTLFPDPDGGIAAAAGRQERQDAKPYLHNNGFRFIGDGSSKRRVLPPSKPRRFPILTVNKQSSKDKLKANKPNSEFDVNPLLPDFRTFKAARTRQAGKSRLMYSSNRFTGDASSKKMGYPNRDSLGMHLAKK